MLDALPETVSVKTLLSLVLLGLAGILVLVAGIFLPRLMRLLRERLVSSQVYVVYQKIVEPYKGLLELVIGLAIAEGILLACPTTELLKLIEFPIGLSLVVAISWLGSRLFKRFFDAYLLYATTQSGGQVSSELLLLVKLLANFLIIVIAVIVFAQTHQINIFGLAASLGISGIAVAFAAQKTLEQLLGGIIIYLDRPFIVDDYIALPDGTFGRVESIGLRSTKVRASGKGTLMVVPNNYITQTTIENFTGAKKVISILYLTFYRAISHEERALIRQAILASTSEIIGINSRRTDVKFRVFYNVENQEITQAQTTFFILGAGEVSMELRRQLLDIAKENIAIKLKEYDIDFDIEEPNIYVDSPITI